MKNNFEKTATVYTEIIRAQKRLEDEEINSILYYFREIFLQPSLLSGSNSEFYESLSAADGSGVMVEIILREQISATGVDLGNIDNVYNFISNLKIDIDSHNSYLLSMIDHFYIDIASIPKNSGIQNNDKYNSCIEFGLTNGITMPKLPSFNYINDAGENFILSLNNENLFKILNRLHDFELSGLLKNKFDTFVKYFDNDLSKLIYFLKSFNNLDIREFITDLLRKKSNDFLKYFDNDLSKLIFFLKSFNDNKLISNFLNILSYDILLNSKYKSFFQNPKQSVSFLLENLTNEESSSFIFTNLIQSIIQSLIEKRDLKSVKEMFNFYRSTSTPFDIDVALREIINNEKMHDLLPEFISIIINDSNARTYGILSSNIDKIIFENESINKEIRKQVEKVFKQKFNMDKYVFEYNSNISKKYKNIDLSSVLEDINKFKSSPSFDELIGEYKRGLPSKELKKILEQQIDTDRQKTDINRKKYIEILFEIIWCNINQEVEFKRNEILFGNKFQDYDDNLIKDISELESNFMIFLKFLTDKKEYYFLENIRYFNYDSVRFYLLAKNKDYIEIYRYFKSNGNFAEKIITSFKDEYILFIKSAGNYYSSIMKYLAKNSQNFSQYLKKIDRAEKVAKLVHNYLNRHVGSVVFENEGFSLDMSSNLEVLDIINEYIKINNINMNEYSKTAKIDELLNIDQLIDKADIINQEVKKINPDKEFINLKEFKDNTTLLKNIISNFFNKRNINYKGDEKTIFKKLHSTFSLMKQYQTVKKYYKVAKPKDEKILQFSLDLSTDLKFEALPFLDPEHFTIGAATDCCQRIGGFGENSAIDSFINPLASSLKLTYKNDIIAQSYFHYVPEDNGLILDNVEFNKVNCNKHAISNKVLANIYSDYAKKIKEKLNLNYVLCGKDYNKFDSSLFESTKLEKDPRYFEITNLNKSIYSDFNHNDAIDLLNPTQDINQYNYQNIKQASNQLTKFAIKYTKKNVHNILSIQLVRMMYLKNLLKNRG